MTPYEQPEGARDLERLGGKNLNQDGRVINRMWGPSIL